LLPEKAVKASFFSRLHRLAAWLVGLQVLLWFGTGLAFTLLPLGDAAVPETQVLKAPVFSLGDYRFNQNALAAHLQGQGLKSLQLTHRLDQPALKLEFSDGSVRMLSADAKSVLKPLSREEAVAQALSAMRAPAEPAGAELLLGSKKGYEWDYWGSYPVWRVDFGGWRGTRIYVDPSTGDVVQRQNIFRRAFDLAYALHVMTYIQTSMFHHPGLMLGAVLALGLALSGWSMLLRRKRR
jgi:uncharacterized iron-regulated membrane protein